MSLCTGYDQNTMTRRAALAKLGGGLGTMALGSLLTRDGYAAMEERVLKQVQHFAPKAKRVIYLFQSGGPSQMDLFDYKPRLIKETGEELPDSVRGGQRLTGMSGNQATLPLVGTPYKFAQHGESGMWMNGELLPYTSQITDEITLINSMKTDAINHGPAIAFLQTGSQLSGRPSIGSWLDYGLGSLNQNLPSFVVLISQGKHASQVLQSRLWGSGFLPSKHDGVRFRSAKDAIVYLNNPKGQSMKGRRLMLDRLKDLHEAQLAETGNLEIENRIAQYEMAFRMQSSIPEVTDFKEEPEHTYKLYGEDAKTPGTYAANCLMARRLCERGVRFVQLYHRGWDQHGKLPTDLPTQCKATDQASAALVKDLKQRGLLEDTVVIWGGEFGRTNYCQGALNPKNFGRDHHPLCFSTWVAGGGFKGGVTHGETDDYCYNIVKDQVHVHDFHATLLNQLGIDHEQLTFKYQGRYFRLTDVHGHIVKNIVKS
ncbi:MAG: DUF1501 domain-containing protein [Akkermansiaceae bacterium]